MAGNGISWQSQKGIADFERAERPDLYPAPAPAPAPAPMPPMPPPPPMPAPAPTTMGMPPPGANASLLARNAAGRAQREASSLDAVLASRATALKKAGLPQPMTAPKQKVLIPQ